ncbi:hypothetical protein AAE02nite_16730 [Adhaeribacter aerolatus]|uniref:Uncharacterized protein n=1 Tax=Adhaeribacter aerolatus TaxID=670289 RepID=A0A512AWB3_9BACT|nr:hypothetical protein [Adhaeribacter aerolatus]GEO04009.1 hypothetical protein AAE02nite_16730 [Adhaeribacter aerolatus]
MTKEEFDDKYTQAIETFLVAMAEHPEVDPKKFYSMTCILENLRFFSPVIYGAIQPAEE